MGVAECTERNRSISWRLEPSHQLARIYPQPLGDLQDVVQRDVASAAFDLADEGPVQAAGISQLFLTFAQLVAAGPDAFTKDSRRW